MTWTLIILSITTWQGNGWSLGTPLPSPYVSTEILTFPTREAAEQALIERQKLLSQPTNPSIQSIPAIAGPYTTSAWRGDALLVSPDGRVENVRAVMGTRKVLKQVEVEEQTGWRVEVKP